MSDQEIAVYLSGASVIKRYRVSEGWSFKVAGDVLVLQKIVRGEIVEQLVYSPNYWMGVEEKEVETLGLHNNPGLFQYDKE